MHSPTALEDAPLRDAPTEQVKTLRKCAGATKPNSYIVKLNAMVSKEIHLSWLCSTRNDTITITYNDWDSYVHHGYAGTFDNEVLGIILASPDVDYVEEDGIVEGSDLVIQTNAPWGLGRISQDPRLANQNPLERSFTYRYDSTAGDGIDIYIMDTGIYLEHDDLGGRAVWGATFGPYPNMDDNGHGTHVAGIAGGSMLGVAKRTRLVAVKVLDSLNTGYTSDIIAGLNWIANAVVNTGHPSVVNMSLVTSASDSLDNAVIALVNRGIYIVCAAGNSNMDAGSISPARVSAAVTVGASTIADARWPLSNYGSVLDIFAPGDTIISAGISGPDSLAIMSGTSMAAPHVSGMFAVWARLFGQLSPSLMTARMDSYALKNILTDIPIGTVNLLARNEEE